MIRRVYLYCGVSGRVTFSSVPLGILPICAYNEMALEVRLIDKLSLVMWKSELSKVSPLFPAWKTKENIKHFEELLRPIDDLPSESGSDSSDLTDIFEEFHKNSFLGAKIAESFTDEFKRTMKSTRKELGIVESMLDEEKAVDEILHSKNAFNKTEVQSVKDPITIKKQNSRKGSTFSQDSTTWEMLKANSTSDFKVSPPIFHCYRDENKHWLERPDISWKRVNESRLKCESWFKDQ
ncbi:hypothetical protein JTB14_025273 [Gonioctena quinquepunctata]|nr:hypothetical protein JTB14_025273 [Gonioctena quinquepunctata]